MSAVTSAVTSAVGVGLDGEYWNVGSGGRTRKATETLDLAAFEADKPVRPRKKRAPLTEEQKKSIAKRAERRGIEKRIQNQIRQDREEAQKRDRMSYIEAKDVVQREGIEIYDGIYVGGRLSAMNHEVLEERGVKGILNVTNEVRMYFKDTGDFDYLRIGADDHRDEPLHKHFEVGVQFIADQKEKGNVHVHCQMGQSRSCTMLVAYGMKCKGWDLAKTITHLHDKHACVGINDGFKRQLMEFEKSLYGSISHNFFPGRAKVPAPPSLSSFTPTKEENPVQKKVTTNNTSPKRKKKSVSAVPPINLKPVNLPFPEQAAKRVKQANIFSFFSKVKAQSPIESVTTTTAVETNPSESVLPVVSDTPVDVIDEVSDIPVDVIEVVGESQEGKKAEVSESPTPDPVETEAANPTEEVTPSHVPHETTSDIPSTEPTTASIQKEISTEPAGFTTQTTEPTIDSTTETPILTNGDKTLVGSSWSVLPIKRKLSTPP